MVAANQPKLQFLVRQRPAGALRPWEATTIDRIEVLWPNGRSEEFPGGAVDRIVELRQGKAAAR